MSDEQLEEPHLIFFRQRPNDLLTRPRLASSLQNLETSFLQIALGRYPAALVSCAAAIESAIKAAFDDRQSSRANFQTLLDRARRAFAPDVEFAPTDLDEFREKRNAIVHYGFSPKDDEIACVLLLKTGYRLIEECYETFFEFSLRGKGDTFGALLPDVDRQLNIARTVYLRAQAENGLNLTYCFISFAHEIRWGMQHWMMSSWQQQILLREEETGSSIFEIQDNQKQELDWKVFDLSWQFDCVICRYPESFVCELDTDELDKGEIRLKRGRCVHCDLVIPKNCPFLADELCAEQFAEALPKILKEIGNG